MLTEYRECFATDQGRDMYEFIKVQQMHLGTASLAGHYG
jgi:hypothetical protein